MSFPQSHDLVRYQSLCRSRFDSAIGLVMLDRQGAVCAATVDLDDTDRERMATIHQRLSPQGPFLGVTGRFSIAGIRLHNSLLGLRFDTLLLLEPAGEDARHAASRFSFLFALQHLIDTDLLTRVLLDSGASEDLAAMYPTLAIIEQAQHQQQLSRDPQTLQKTMADVCETLGLSALGLLYNPDNLSALHLSDQSSAAGLDHGRLQGLLRREASDWASYADRQITFPQAISSNRMPAGGGDNPEMSKHGSEDVPQSGLQAMLLEQNQQMLVFSLHNDRGRSVGSLIGIREAGAGAPSTGLLRTLGLFAGCIERQFLTDFDPVTGFLNTAGFEFRVAAFREAMEKGNTSMCLVGLQIPSLNRIEYQCGEQAQTRAWHQLSAWLGKRLRTRDLIARTSPTEIVIFLTSCDLRNCKIMVSELLQALQGVRFVDRGRHFDLSAHVGIVPVRGKDFELTERLHVMRRACQSATLELSGIFVDDQIDDNNEAGSPVHTLDWANRVNETLISGNLALYGQPVVATVNEGYVYQYEVLLRVRSSDSVLVAPAVFVDAAERSGMMQKIDRSILETALQAFSQGCQQSGNRSAMLSLNLSGHTLVDGFVAEARELAEKYQLDTGSICFEVSEAATYSDFNESAALLRQLKRAGFKLSLDDVGASPGSLAQLQNLGVDHLKIDTRFVQSVHTNPVSEAIVRSVDAIAKALGIQTIAEGVESEQALTLLQQIGIDFCQGYYVAKPRPLAELFANDAADDSRQQQLT